ncbi:MAG: family 78 glycoside hydrolase catalytic domain [Victivallales bacterium]|nr:family 78 glycoside hydrolase catalytic domain [Victivallales bacterium]
MDPNIASWIAPKGLSRRRSCHFHARRDFELEEVPDNLELQIACESYYLLKVNDVTLGRGPARGSSGIYYYDSYQIAAFLHCGTNRIHVEVLCMNIPTGRNVPAEATLWVRCGNILGTDAKWQCLVSEQEWLEDAPFYTMQQGLCEWRDLRYADKLDTVPTDILPPTSPVLKRRLLRSGIPVPIETRQLPLDLRFPAWTGTVDLNDRRIAVLGDRDSRNPVPEGTASLLNELCFGGEHSVILPAPPGNGGFSVILDFGKMVTGRLEVELTASPGTVVDIAHEEALGKNGNLRSDHTATNATYNFCDRYITGNGRQTIGNHLVDRGFRVVRLTFRNFTGDVTLHRIEGIDRRYPMSKKGRFFSSDYQLNRLWDAAFETISACTTDVFTDCPWRERLFFTNDFVVECRSALQLTGEYALVRHALELIFSEMDENGIFPCVIPQHGSMLAFHGLDKCGPWILSCNLTLPLSVLEYVLYSGDAASLEQWYPLLLRMMNTFRAWKTPDGCIDVRGNYQGDTTFFDWSFELNGKQISSCGSALMNCLYIIALQAMDRLGAFAGFTQISFADEIQEMRTATIRNFFLDDEQMLLDVKEAVQDEELLRQCGVPIGKRGDFRSSKASNALAILANLDMARPGIKKIFINALLSEECFPPELFYSSFVLLALKAEGLDNDCIGYVRRYWGPMLDSGTPTLWENGVYSAGKEGFGGSASLCHGFSTSPVDYLQTALIGISPLEPGFKVFRFAPSPCGLDFADGSVPTPHGAIHVSWKMQDGQIVADIFVPEGCMGQTPNGTISPGNNHIVCDISHKAYPKR